MTGVLQNVLLPSIFSQLKLDPKFNLAQHATVSMEKSSPMFLPSTAVYVFGRHFFKHTSVVRIGMNIAPGYRGLLKWFFYLNPFIRFCVKVEQTFILTNFYIDNSNMFPM